jgi:hypothetical protein
VSSSILIALLCCLAFFLAPLVYSPVFFIFTLLLLGFWFALLGTAVYRFRWRGLWVLAGAPIALAWPCSILYRVMTCGKYCL